MGSMPVWPQDCALMMVVTKLSATTTTEATGERPSPKQASSAQAATPTPRIPASVLTLPLMSERASSPCSEELLLRPRTMPAT